MDFYIFEDYSDLGNLPLVNIEWTFYPIFLLFVSIFTTDEVKEGKNQFFNYFWRMLLKFEEKKFEIHKLNQLLITWLLKELKSYKPLLKTFLLSKTYVKNDIQKLELSLSWTNLCVIQIIASSLFGFWVIESQLSWL